jgi:hypothetical protein
VTTGEAIAHVEKITERQLSRNTVKSWISRHGDTWPGLRRTGSGRLIWSCWAVEFLVLLATKDGKPNNKYFFPQTESNF